MKNVAACVLMLCMGSIVSADTISWDARKPAVMVTLINGVPVYSADCSGPLSMTAGNKAEYLFRKSGTNDAWRSGGVNVTNGTWAGTLAAGGKWEIKPVIKDGTGKIIAEGAVKTADIPVN